MREYGPEYEFEDLFEVVTPSGVESRILSLDTAWETLFNTNRSDKYIAGEYQAWLIWREKINSSMLSKIFASGTLNELDDWKERYSAAFIKAPNKKDAPSPTLFKTEEQKEEDSSPLIPAWVLVAGGIGLGLALVWYLSSSTKPIRMLTSKL